MYTHTYTHRNLKAYAPTVNSGYAWLVGVGEMDGYREKGRPFYFLPYILLSYLNNL